GTIDQHPNWRRKLPFDAETAFRGPSFRAMTKQIAALRPARADAKPPFENVKRGPRGQRRPPTNVPLPPGRLPRATYRVQLNRDFGFRDATALVPYLATLGISHLYCSPYLRARPGSKHGYDVVDHTMLNPEIGSREDFDAMVAALRAHDMSHLCDVVPNHMAIMGRDNAWWMDVLENGAASRYADFFDIGWSSADPELSSKVLVPLLGDAYGAVLDRGELKLAYENDTGAFVVQYFEHRLPIDMREAAPIVALALQAVEAPLPGHASAEIESLVDALRRLPARDDASTDSLVARRRDVPLHKARLAALVQTNDALRAAIDAIVTRYNGSVGTPGSFEALHALLEAQAYRLAYWRVASDEINYRRFFDVNELASLRMENEAAFDATHDFVLRLLGEGHIGGLRIDHPDGLLDPADYFARLQRAYRERSTNRDAASDGVYVAIEKIGAPHEHLPAQWPVHGDTGYRFANTINGVLIDPTARSRIDRAWRAFVGDEARDFEQAAHDGKRAMMEGSLAAGLNALAGAALRVARVQRNTRDLTLSTLRDALAEVVAWFPVYRTYVTASGASAQDRRYIEWAVTRARNASRVADPSVFDFVHSLLLAAPPADATQTLTRSYVDFAMRFQQYTAPVTAKGVEDTSFYTHTRFVSLNDVGGDPGQFGLTRRAFHRITTDRASAWPHTMLATSTHDNKRSEDVRARLDVISERPAAWRLTVRRWSRQNRSRKTAIDGDTAPSRSDEYLLYQTIVGSFPPGDIDEDSLAAYRERVTAYMIKAAREAKARTSWLRVDSAYESALTTFVEALLTPRPDDRFLDDVRTQVATFAWFGMLNSLTMMLVKLASPGVPDIYQGNELLDYSLVDPDNRRAVDYAMRRVYLEQLTQKEAFSPDQRPPDDLFAQPYDGRAKQWIANRLLNYRKAQRALFDDGDYAPVSAGGTFDRHVLAFARRHENHGLVAIAGRLFASMDVATGTLPLGEAAWRDTSIDLSLIPTGTEVCDILSGTTFALREPTMTIAQLFARFPAAALVW
ncbi:MAG TPA: malto-oligosyltrehalose synthase, partial [Casimicrobiaceae bacterium]|nr:malto-oligosyltrehalose synthase [Casimicrobiaceae bacterium]